METIDTDCLKQLDNLLAAGDQSWLFGAGISLGANIPLMRPLTARVFAKANEAQNKRAKEVLDAVKAVLPDDSHIEHILSHLIDLAAIAERSRTQKVEVGKVTLELAELRDLHAKALKWISETVRWGFVPKAGDDTEKIGTRENPIVTVDEHKAFVSALFNRNQAGIAERRRAVRLFTINYDTLLEDALALGCFSHWDGFTGGAVAYRSHRYGQDEPDSGYRAHVIKIHGSIDWHLGTDDRVWRVRDGDLYPERLARVLIYPQFTKYLATQRDPFAAQFDLFRRSLGSGTENVLAVCGYSFGDEHINQEIELALQHPENKATILAFSQSLNSVLDKWRAASWAKRLYIIAESGLYVGSEGPFFPPSAGKKLDWWTFAGVTKILNSGAEACVL
jgi:SIR2-like domain